MRNPWIVPPTEAEERDHGRAVITVARQAGGHRFPASLVRALVKKYLRVLLERTGRHEGASLAYQVGMTGRWASEPSYEVKILNLSSSVQSPLPWASFLSLARSVVVALGDDLQQEMVLLETFSSRGYTSSVYENSGAVVQRAARASRSAHGAASRALEASRVRSPNAQRRTRL